MGCTSMTKRFPEGHLEGRGKSGESTLLNLVILANIVILVNLEDRAIILAELAKRTTLFGPEVLWESGSQRPRNC